MMRFKLIIWMSLKSFSHTNLIVLHVTDNAHTFLTFEEITMGALITILS
jgi:hypothetical protein